MRLLPPIADELDLVHVELVLASGEIDVALQVDIEDRGVADVELRIRAWMVMPSAIGCARSLLGMLTKPETCTESVTLVRKSPGPW